MPRRRATRLSRKKIGTPLRRPYEWSTRLTYRYEDRVIGGTFSMALDLALLGLASQAGDAQTIAWVLDANGNALRTRSPGRGGTVGYMTYSARLATLLCQTSGSCGRPLMAEMRPLLTASWTYLARFFGPDAVPSPNPRDVIHTDTCLPRFAPAYQIVGRRGLLAALRSGDRSSYYEPQFLGPVSLTSLLPD